jgi:hypothetical protein
MTSVFGPSSVRVIQSASGEPAEEKNLNGEEPDASLFAGADLIETEYPVEPPRP